MGYFPLCQLRLIMDANYPWFILVPQRKNIEEIFELSDDDQQQLTRESAQLSSALSQQVAADKMNVAAIGNVVPQLHIHHIVRYKNDPAWPAPVWGKLPAKAYTDDQLQLLRQKLKRCYLKEFIAV